ncbi:MAG: glycosyltransferase family 2 protein [Anaeroplasmataceae bacterium]|nr:glycosyltransferase family 2 protein [Anaeroplasmataceae bacterium]
MKKKLDIVITMAGLGSRFKKAGYVVPKYMIEAHGKTLFEWSISSLSGYQNMVEQFIFIVRKEDNSLDFIQSACKKLEIKSHQVIEIDYLTDGQATTALLGKQVWNKENGLLIYNIDTYVEPENMTYDELKGAGFIPCFKGKGEHWSFVRLDDFGKAVEVKEKVRISDFCTLGAYYFSSCKLYEELYKEYYSTDKKLEKGEKYVAPLYNYLIEKGEDVFISVVDSNAIHVLGTPEELEIFLQQG